MTVVVERGSKVQRGPERPPPARTEAVIVVPEPSCPPPSEQRIEPRVVLIESQTLILPRERALKAAQDHLSLPNSPTERGFEKRREHELIERIKGGTWLPCNWATVHYENVKYRMNGQHSSHAMVSAAEYLPDRVSIHIDHYRADDRDSMALLFRQFDARFSGRTKQDVSGAYQGLVSELQDVARDKAKLAVEGVVWYERVVEKSPTMSGDAMYGIFFREMYYPFIHWMDKIFSSKTRELRHLGVVASMYATFLKSESGAQDFWPHVARQDVPDDKDPRTFLGNELLTFYESKEGKPLTQSEYYCKGVKAWNAWRYGDKVSTLKVAPQKGWPTISD